MKRAAKVLVIEDNLDDYFLLKNLMAGEGSPAFQLESATRLATGLAMLDRGEYDVVLLDLVLPDSSRDDTFLLLHDQHPEIPIVVLSGIRDRELALRAVRQG